MRSKMKTTSIVVMVALSFLTSCNASLNEVVKIENASENGYYVTWPKDAYDFFPTIEPAEGAVVGLNYVAYPVNYSEDKIAFYLTREIDYKIHFPETKVMIREVNGVLKLKESKH